MLSNSALAASLTADLWLKAAKLPSPLSALGQADWCTVTDGHRSTLCGKKQNQYNRTHRTELITQHCRHSVVR